MYWDAYQLDRPNERPFALHRNGGGDGKVCGLLMVGRCELVVGDLEEPGADRNQQRPERDSVLGHRHRRVCADAGVYGRTIRPVVPVRRVLPALPMPRAGLDAAIAVGLE